MTQICSDFGADYWSGLDDEGKFPHAFHQAMAKAAGSASRCRRPYGGAGLGITEAALIMQTVSASGAGFPARRPSI
ncbi:acyl-CoA dehydrogenase family protein [Cupriavidus basilensis]